MSKEHLKRYYAPRAWKIKRKGIKFVTKQNPGPHSAELSMPLNLVIRDLLNFAETTREVKKLLYKNNVIVDGRRRKDHRFPIGLFDTLEFKETGNYYRAILNNKGNLQLNPIQKNEAGIKPCKIVNKSIVKGKLQLNLNDGKNILVDKNNYETSDTVFLELPSNNIKDHIKLEKGSLIFLTGGKHIGEIGKVEDIISNRIIYKTESNDVVETLRRFAFVIGKEKPLISIKR